MTGLARIPIRLRITAAFAAVMTILLVGMGIVAHQWMSSALLDEVDSGLRFRAAATEPSGPGQTSILAGTPDPRLQEPYEAFEQLLGRDGQVLRATAGYRAPLLTPAETADITGPAFFDRHVPHLPGTARLLAVPAQQNVLVVGASLSDRSDALRRLGEVFVIGGPVAIAVAWLASWAFAGWALHPVERMRRQASAITVSGLDRRLTVPGARDELNRLARTLNDMLGRLDSSLTRERAFLEQAGHELRTPLAALRAEVDLALHRRRSSAELTAALHSVSQEIDRLAQLAEDLLVLARADDGRLPLHRQVVSLRDVLESTASLFTARALGDGIALEVDAADTLFEVDPLRIRQALVNLLDNALRHTPRDGSVRMIGTAGDTDVRIDVSDTGPGIPDVDDRPGVSGLGLRIVRAIVASHRGTVRISRNGAGGATVQLRLPRTS